MKIAYYCSTREATPHKPGTIAANSDVMLNIINELKAKHDIELYASKDSKVSGVKLVHLGLKAHGLDSAFNKEDWVKNVYTAYILRYLTEIAYRSAQYDIIHLHVGKLYMGMPFARVCQCPVVLTIHQQLEPKESEILESFPGAYLVSISNNQRKRIPSLDYFATVYNGTDINEYKFNSEGGRGYIFRSRIVPEKGVEDAIIAVNNTQGELNIYGPGKEDYLKKSVLSAVNDKIKYQGITGPGMQNNSKSYQEAKALIMPIQWAEPFGLVLIEAMACGTPVIAYDRGSVPEIVKDGETGFIVNSSKEDKRGNWIINKTGVEGLVDAITMLNQMPKDQYKKMRLNCRQHVENKFSIQTMAKAYEEVYQEVIDDFQKRKN